MPDRKLRHSRHKRRLIQIRPNRRRHIAYRACNVRGASRSLNLRVFTRLDLMTGIVIFLPGTLQWSGPQFDRTLGATMRA